MCLQKEAQETAPTVHQSKDRVYTNLHYVPIVGFACSCLAILVPYCIAVYVGDVPAFLPYISDVGGDPPQSILFGIGLLFTAVIGVAGMSLKYFMVQEQNFTNNPMIDKLNKLTLCGGFMIFLGMLLVVLCPTGHLRRDGSWYWPLFVPHMVGAATVFGVGYFVAVIHLYLQILLDASWRSSRLFYLRVVLCIIGITAMIFTSFYWPIFNTHGLDPTPHHGRKYPSGMLKSIIGEWVIVVVFQVYVLTYLSDFRKATFKFRIELSTHKKDT